MNGKEFLTNTIKINQKEKQNQMHTGTCFVAPLTTVQICEQDM